MSKFNVVACTLTSALAVSLGSIGVYAAPETTAQSTVQEQTSAGALGDAASLTRAEDEVIESAISLTYIDGELIVSYISPYSIPLHFSKYEVLLNDKVIAGNEIDSTSSEGTLTFSPKENGTYRVNVYFDATDAVASGEMVPASGVITSTISIADIEKPAEEAPEKTSSESETSSTGSSTESEKKQETSSTSTVSEKKQESSETTVSETSLVDAGPSNLNGKVTASYNVSMGTLKAVSDVNCHADQKDGPECGKHSNAKS